MPSTYSAFVERPHNVIRVAWRSGAYACLYESRGPQDRTVTVYLRDEIVYVKPCVDASDAYRRALELREPPAGA